MPLLTGTSASWLGVGGLLDIFFSSPFSRGKKTQSKLWLSRVKISSLQPQVVIGQNSQIEKYPRFISRLSLIFFTFL